MTRHLSNTFMDSLGTGCIPPRSTLSSILAGLFLAFGTPLLAQEAVSVQIEDRVRIETTQGDVHEGWVRTLAPGTIDLEQLEGGGLLTVHTTSVLDLQVHQGRTRFGVGKGIGLGLLGGVVIGALLGGIGDPCDSELCFDSHGEAALFGAVVMSILTVPIGLIAGALIKVDRWEPGTLSPALQVSPTGAGGMSVGVKLRYPSR